MHRRSLAFVVLIAGCGGKLARGVDGGTDAALDTGSSTHAGTCTAITFSNPPPNPGGSCDATGSWTCGTTEYSIECTCGVQGADPQCTCTAVTGTLSTVTGGSQASCVCYGLTGESVADVCGFPH